MSWGDLVAEARDQRTEGKEKSGAGRWVPMTPRLRQAMKEHFARYRFGGSPWVFHHTLRKRHAEKGARIRGLHRAFRSAAARAKLPPELRQHDLRHRRVTSWLAEGKESGPCEGGHGPLNHGRHDGLHTPGPGAPLQSGGRGGAPGHRPCIATSLRPALGKAAHLEKRRFTRRCAPFARSAARRSRETTSRADLPIDLPRRTTVLVENLREPFCCTEAPPGFEPGIEDLQSSALPLGYGANAKGSVVHGRRSLRVPERETGLEPATLTLAR